jgi:4-diphosphocytidyl-2-C-methyl-D-erythritol kinase
VALELIAPAKINLTLEVVGRRPDGYHDIASVIQTIDLSDRIRLESADSLEIEVSGERAADVPEDASRNLVYCAAVALRDLAGRPDLSARIRLEKRIPAGAGLGGGSSDAAAVLRGLNRFWRLKFDDVVLARLATEMGSDVPFFLIGGTAVVVGRGEQVQALPDVQPFSLTLFVSDVQLEEKTRRMYGTLTESDFTKGERTGVLIEKTRLGAALSPEGLVNAFDLHIKDLSQSAASAMAACRDAGLNVVATGSGPGFFALTPKDEIPHELLLALARGWGVSTIAARSLNRADAAALQDLSGG